MSIKNGIEFTTTPKPSKNTQWPQQESQPGAAGPMASKTPFFRSRALASGNGGGFGPRVDNADNRFDPKDR